MITYHVRSRDLITVINEVRAERLILDAYFQRNLVWRDIHKQDFIKTILLGYPCPQIFISRGKIDVENMRSIACVVDGQQRLSTIRAFIDNEFPVDGKRYFELSPTQKEEFLKYELAVIELDLDNNDPKVKEIFQLLNRTSSSLTSIEKLASQFAPSQYMLVASHLADELEWPPGEEDVTHRVDPAVDPEFFEWAAATPVVNFRHLIMERGVFKPHEISRKVHLMHVLNLMTTFHGGFFNRNEKSREYLELFSTSFDEKDAVVARLEAGAAFISSLGLPSGSYWLNKANIFTLLVLVDQLLTRNPNLDVESVRGVLAAFEADVPDSYRQATTEGVNDLRERRTRHRVLSDFFAERGLPV